MHLTAVVFYKREAELRTVPVSERARDTSSSSDRMELNETYNEARSGNALNSTEFETEFEIAAEEISKKVNLIYTPIVVIMGSLGNLISIVVFYATKLHLQSTSQYLSALAFCDTCFLLQLIPPWLQTMEFTNIFSRQGLCQFFVYISYVTSSQSTWLVVAFTVERFIAVLRPLQRNVFCTITRSRYVITAIMIMGFVVNLPLLRYAISRSNQCSVDYHYMVPASRFNLVDTALAFSAPLLVIIVLNGCIMHRVWRVGRLRRSEQGEALRNRVRTGTSTHQYRVTRMLLLVSSVFVILNLPAYVMRMMSYACNKKTHEFSGKWQAFQQITLMFFNTNFGINFILYCLSGQNFRRALKQCIPWLRRKERRRMTDRMAPSSQPGRASSISTSYVSGTEPSAQTINPPDAQKRRTRKTFLKKWRSNNAGRQNENTERIQMANVAVTQDTYDDLI